MHILHGFWYILRTTSFVFAFVLSSINFAFADDCIGENNGTPSPTSAVSGLLTWDEMEAAGIITGSGSSWAPTSETMDDYLAGQEWSVTFDNGIVNGYAGCTATGWKTTQSYSAISSANAGCACSLDKNTWWFLRKLDTGTDRYTKTEYCRANCPAACANEVATNATFRDKLFNNACPVIQQTPTTQYTINYDMDGGTGCETVQTYTDTATICEPTRDGYTFDGWMDNNTSDTYNGGDVVSHVNLDLVAFWTEIPVTKYAILYNMSGGTGCTDTEYTNSTTLCTPTRDGYRFDNWSDNITGNTYNGGGAVSGVDLDLTAQWTFVGCANGQYFANDMCNSCPNGYNFSNSTTATSQNDCYRNCTTNDVSNANAVDGIYYYDGTNTCNATSCYTGWHINGTTCEIDTYTIVYNSNGGTDYENASYTIESDTITLPVPVRDGYDFNGWYNNAEFNGYPITEITYGSHENITLYAKWTKTPCDDNYYGDGFTCTACPNAYPNSTNTDNGDITKCYATVNYTNYCAPNDEHCYKTPKPIYYYYTSENPDGYVVSNLLELSNTDDYTFGGWYLNSEYTGDEIVNGYILSGNQTLYGKWDEIITTEWGCRAGVVNADADSWTEETKENLTSSRDLYTQGVVSPTYGDSYVISSETPEKAAEHLNAYIAGEEFFVTWGDTTIRGWAGCGPNTWNSKSEYNYTLQSLVYTNAGCGCSLNKKNWAVKRNLLTVNGSDWFEKNEYCRANCPAACANAVANDQNFRELLFNGQCPAEYVEQITCEPGYYLPGGTTTCKKCTGNDTYCTGGTFEQSDADQGVTKCPDIVNYPGAYHTKKESLLSLLNDDSLNDSIETCVALFWFTNPDVTGDWGLDRDAAYDANSVMNQNVILHTPFCFYNETTQMYDRCFNLPGMYYPTMCKKGYTINPELLTHVPDLGDNWSDVYTETMHSVWNEQMNYLGNLVNPCVLAEPGYYTGFYDLFKDDSDSDRQRLASNIGVISAFGHMVTLTSSAPGFEPSNEIYKQCPGEYPESAAGSWQKAHCYANLTYVFNDGTEDIVDKHYYSDSTVDGYQTNLPNAERNGYEFVGWYNNAEFDGDAVTNETVFAGNTTLYARWTPLSCEDGYYIDETQCSACPTGFTSDGEYAERIDDCYKISTVNCSDVNPYAFEHASDIVYGNSAHGVAPCKTYYGTEDCILDDENACVITGLTCENGYVLRGNELIGINQGIDATNYTVSDYNWTAEFDYGTINGESMCSNITPYYGVGYGETHTDYEQCFCRIASYTKTNGEQTNINSRWANFGFIGNYIPATPDMTVIRDGQEVVIPGMQETYISRCSTRCPALCASAFAENSSNTTVGNGVYTNARNTLFNNATLLKCEPFDCQSGIWMHIGDNARACLSKQKASNPAFVIEYDNTPYYLNMSSDDVPVNGTTNTKMKVYYHGNEYSIYDNSINN